MSYIVSCMTDNGFGVAVLVDEKGKLSGVITDGDLRRNINDLLTFSPIDVATLNPVTVKPSDLVSVALEKMEKHKIYAVIVTKKKSQSDFYVCTIFCDQVLNEDNCYHSSALRFY